MREVRLVQIAYEFAVLVGGDKQYVDFIHPRANREISDWSSVFSVAAAGLAPLNDGAPDTYADCARNCPIPKRVASKRPKTRILQFVYFMPKESNFFTLNCV